MDVKPNEIIWVDLVSKLSLYPYIKVLVTVREEDFKRAAVPKYAFEFSQLRLEFNKAEAEKIYNRAIENEPSIQSSFLNFKASWDKFGLKGQLLEYVYLLTQSETLESRLAEQLGNISNQVAGYEITDKWDVLRWVSIASAYESKISFEKMRGLLKNPSRSGSIIRELEDEYLIRVSENQLFIDGLHPVRSQILTDLMCKEDPYLWFQTAREVLPILDESDLQAFLLNAFVLQSKEEQNHY